MPRPKLAHMIARRAAAALLGLFLARAPASSLKDLRRVGMGRVCF